MSQIEALYIQNIIFLLLFHPGNFEIFINFEKYICKFNFNLLFFLQNLTMLIQVQLVLKNKIKPTLHIKKVSASSLYDHTCMISVIWIFTERARSVKMLEDPCKILQNLPESDAERLCTHLVLSLLVHLALPNKQNWRPEHQIAVKR